MDFGINVGAIFQFFLPTLFAFWPILILSPLTWNRASIKQMAAIWGILAFLRCILVFLPGQGIALIPEPANTAMFVSAGVVLIGISLVQRLRGGRPDLKA